MTIESLTDERSPMLNPTCIKDGSTKIPAGTAFTKPPQMPLHRVRFQPNGDKLLAASFEIVKSGRSAGFGSIKAVTSHAAETAVSPLSARTRPATSSVSVFRKSSSKPLVISTFLMPARA